MKYAFLRKFLCFTTIGALLSACGEKPNPEKPETTSSQEDQTEEKTKTTSLKPLTTNTIYSNNSKVALFKALPAENQDSLSNDFKAYLYTPTISPMRVHKFKSDSYKEGQDPLYEYQFDCTFGGKPLALKDLIDFKGILAVVQAFGVKFPQSPFYEDGMDLIFELLKDVIADLFSFKQDSKDENFKSTFAIDTIEGNLNTKTMFSSSDKEPVQFNFHFLTSDELIVSTEGQTIYVASPNFKPIFDESSSKILGTLDYGIGFVSSVNLATLYPSESDPSKVDDFALFKDLIAEHIEAMTDEQMWSFLNRIQGGGINDFVRGIIKDNFRKNVHPKKAWLVQNKELKPIFVRKK